MKPQRPAYGEPCNGCGRGSQKEQCPLSLWLFGKHPGACPALEDVGDRFVCGLAANPQKHNPFRTAAVGRDKMSKAALTLIGADSRVGCDCAETGDLVNDAYRNRDDDHRRYVNRPAYAKAMKTWGVWRD